jgi:hypothetical protein
MSLSVKRHKAPIAIRNSEGKIKAAGELFFLEVAAKKATMANAIKNRERSRSDVFWITRK